jgi:hypothetical protein
MVFKYKTIIKYYLGGILMANNSKPRMSSATIKQLEKDYISGLRIVDIQQKYGVAFNTIQYHRKKALKERGIDWLKTRENNLTIINDKANEQDFHIEKISEILDTFLAQLEVDLRESDSIGQRLKIATTLEKTFALKMKSIASVLRGNKETLLAGSRIYAEILIQYLHNFSKDNSTLDIEEFIEILPDIYNDVKRRVEKS